MRFSFDHKISVSLVGLALAACGTSDPASPGTQAGLGGGPATTTPGVPQTGVGGGGAVVGTKTGTAAVAGGAAVAGATGTGTGLVVPKGGAGPVATSPGTSPLTGGSGGAGSVSTGTKPITTGGTTSTTTTTAVACTSTPLPSWKAFTPCKADVAKLETLYAAWKKTYATDCGTTAFVSGEVILNGSNQKASVSEGAGYAMLISAALGKTADFTKFYAYYKEKAGSGFMPWAYSPTCGGGKVGDGSATDADLDAAMALVIAGKTNPTYLADAKTLIGKLAGLLIPCSGRNLIKSGDGGWATCNDLNASYFAPGYYRVFAKLTNDTAWNKAADDALAMIEVWQGKMAKGQVPDWGKGDGSLGGSTKTSAVYGFDACRMPWRVVMDYGWFQTAKAKAVLDTLRTKAIGTQSPASSNVVTDDQKNSCFIGGYAMTGFAVDQSTADKYFAAWANGAFAGDNKYFTETLKLLFMITAMGRLDSGL